MASSESNLAGRLWRYARDTGESISTTEDFLSKGLAYSLVEVALQGAAIAVLPIVFFFLSLSDFGVITWALVLSQATMTVGTLGLDFSLMRFYLAWPEEARAAIVARVGRLVLVWSLVLALGTYFVLAGLGISDGFWSLAFGAWAGLGLGLRNVPLSVLRVTGAVGPYARFVLTGATVQSLTQIALVAAGWGPIGYVLGYGTGAAVTGLLANRAVRRRPEIANPIRLPADLVSYTVRVFPSLLFNRLLLVADRLILFNWHDLAALGLYGAASRFTMPVKLLSGGLKLAMVPAMSRAEAENVDQVNVFAGIGRLMVLAMLLVGSLLSLGGWLVAFTPWSDRAAELQRLIVLLLAAHLLGGLAFVGQVGLYYSPRPQAATLVGGVNAVVLLGGLLLLVPRLGGPGAAGANLLAAAVSLGVVAIIAVHAIGRVAPWPELLALTMSFAPAVAATWWLGRAAQLVVVAAMIAAYAIGTVLLVARSRPGAMETSKP